MKFFLSVISALLILSSCSRDGGWDSDPSYEGDDGVVLSFRMLTPGDFSRARSEDATTADSDWISFEDRIDASSTSIFVFARFACDEEEKLVMKVIDLTSPDSPDVIITGSPGLYTVNMKIKRKLLRDVLGEELSLAGRKDVWFRILVLANWDKESGRHWGEVSGDVFSRVIDNLSSWKFPMSEIYDDSGLDAGGLYAGKYGAIPMFGSHSVSVSESALSASRYENPVALGNVEMLRALAKVRVEDRIAIRDADGYPKIVQAEIVSSKTDAFHLPYGAKTYLNGSQVDLPNIVDPDADISEKGVFRMGIIPVESSSDDNSGLLRIGYIPEQKISIINNDVNQGLPAFRLKVAMYKDTDGSDFTKEFIVPMTRYKDTVFQFGSDILRNHIYTLSVTNVTNDRILLNIAVKDWRKFSFEYEY